MNKIESQINSSEELENCETTAKLSVKSNLLIPRLYEKTFTSKTPYKLVGLKRYLPKIKESKFIYY